MLYEHHNSTLMELYPWHYQLNWNKRLSMYIFIEF